MHKQVSQGTRLIWNARSQGGDGTGNIDALLHTNGYKQTRLQASRCKTKRSAQRHNTQGGLLHDIGRAEIDQAPTKRNGDRRQEVVVHQWTETAHMTVMTAMQCGNIAVVAEDSVHEGAAPRAQQHF